MDESNEINETPTQALEEETKELVTKLVQSNDVKEVSDLTKLFNLNQVKKNALRIDKLNALLDLVHDQAIQRVEKRPDAISNKELLEYMQIVQNSIEKSQKVVNSVDETPIVQINHQTNVFNVDNNQTITLDRDSRERILEAVRHYMQQNNIVEEDNNIIEIESPEVDVEISEEEKG